MTTTPRVPSPGVPRLLRLAFWATVAGVVLSLLLLLRPGPYTVTVFMTIAQPLLVVGCGLFAFEVVRDLRGRKVLGPASGDPTPRDGGAR
jgi:hypothetical protein